MNDAVAATQELQEAIQAASLEYERKLMEAQLKFQERALGTPPEPDQEDLSYLYPDIVWPKVEFAPIPPKDL